MTAARRPARRASAPTSTFTPAFPLRGVMLDLGRVVERREYYALLLPRLAEWGYNLLHLHLIDDQRCALRFPSHPELTSPGAYEPEEMREFVALAGQLGIAVMPEIECLGHTALIAKRARPRGLGEKPPPGQHFNALCPSHPGTRKVLEDLLRDTAEIFPYGTIHVGLDEVEFGRCPRCRRRFGARAEAWQRFAAHAAWVHAEVRSLGRRPAMWADHVVHEPRIVKSFRRDVLMFNWQYIPEYESTKAAALLAAGFEVVACPATVCYSTRILPNAGNLTNLRNCTMRSLPQRRKGLVGMVNTVWCPWRYLPGAIDYGMALCGQLFADGEEDPGLARKFAESFYGLVDGRKAAAAIEALHDVGFEQRLHDRTVDGAARGEPFTSEDRRQMALVARRLPPLIAALRAERRKVRRNLDRYDDLVLSARAALAVARFGASGRRKGSVPEARQLYRQAEAAWNRDRLPGDPIRLGEGFHGSVQALLRTLRVIGS